MCFENNNAERSCRALIVLVPLLIAASLAGCAVDGGSGSRDRMWSQDSASAPEPAEIRFSEAASIADIRDLQPQARLPLDIAVMPPFKSKALSQSEREVINKWGSELRSIGYVDKLTIVPESLVPSCSHEKGNDCYINESRASGARLGADAVLFLSEDTTSNRRSNALGILDWTIVGMYIVPAHHLDTFSIYEAALFDINNGYLYLVADGEGENHRMRPLHYLNRDYARDRARVQALDDLGRTLFQRATQAQIDQRQ